MYKDKKVSELLRLATKYFNKFIRLRDTDENGYGRCISSGKLLKYGTEEAQAGHYWSAGKFPRLRFNEYNVNLQSRNVNYYKEGDHETYRKNLIKKYGKKIVEELDKIAEDRSPFKWDRDYLIEVIETYKQKCKELQKEKNI